MLWFIGGITFALVAFATALGGVATGALLLTAIAWLLLVLRPAEAGAIVADWSERRFE